MGKKWGNALGGYLSQPRLPNGQFASTGIARKSFRLHLKAKKRRGGFVPYFRKGLGHTTVGINSGVSITKNRRVSAGFYVRTDSMRGQKQAMKIAKKQEFAQLAVASRMPTGYGLGKKSETGARTLGGNLKRVKRHQANIIHNVIGKETKTGTYTHTRLATDRNALPVLAVRWNSPKDRKKGSRRKRNKAMTAYNASSATGKRTYDWTQKPVNSRPQRRNKARAMAVTGTRV